MFFMPFWFLAYSVALLLCTNGNTYKIGFNLQEERELSNRSIPLIRPTLNP